MSEMTAKKLIDLLKKNGYNEVSIKGDHHKYKRETDGKNVCRTIYIVEKHDCTRNI